MLSISPFVEVSHYCLMKCCTIDAFFWTYLWGKRTHIFPCRTLVDFCGGHSVLVFAIFRKANSCWTYVIVEQWNFLCIKCSSPRETFICWQWNEEGYAGVLFGGKWCYWHLFVRPRVSSQSMPYLFHVELSWTSGNNLKFIFLVKFIDINYSCFWVLEAS